MDITNHIQNSTNPWHKQITKQGLVNIKIVSISIIAILLTIVLISGSIVSSNVFAAKSPSPRDVCNVFSQGTCSCGNNIEDLTATCCTITPGSTPENGIMICERCSINTATGEYYNCEVSRKSPTTGETNFPNNEGTLEQPPQKHNPKDNAKVPNNNGGIEQNSQLSNNPTSNQNNPQQLQQTNDEQSAKSNNNNNKDNSPTPPPCPNKGPIPPNCTLKPIFK